MTDNDQRDDMPGIPPVESPESHPEPNEAQTELRSDSSAPVAETAEAFLIPHVLPSEPMTEADGWSVNETPHFAFDAEPPALQHQSEPPVQPRTPTAVIESDADSDFDVTPAEVQQAVHAATEELYDDETPALEAAAEAELISGASPGIGDSAASESLSESEEAYRIRVLTRTIAQYPDAPANYVLRGEVYLALGETERAAEDFQKAIDLADALDPELDWGYINTAYIDRAVEGLRQINP